MAESEEYDCAQYSIQKPNFGRSCGNQGFPTFCDRSDELFVLSLTFCSELDSDLNSCVGMKASERYATVGHMY